MVARAYPPGCINVLSCGQQNISRSQPPSQGVRENMQGEKEKAEDHVTNTPVYLEKNFPLVENIGCVHTKSRQDTLLLTSLCSGKSIKCLNLLPPKFSLC